jgi:hypothetical protein
VASIAIFYARHLERLAAQGMPRAYVEDADRLNGLRGRVDLPALRRTTGLPLPFPCRFDEHAANFDHRILRAAAEQVGRFPGVTVESRAALRAWIASTPEIGALHHDDMATQRRSTDSTSTADRPFNSPASSPLAPVSTYGRAPPAPASSWST